MCKIGHSFEKMDRKSVWKCGNQLDGERVMSMDDLSSSDKSESNSVVLLYMLEKAAVFC